MLKRIGYIVMIILYVVSSAKAQRMGFAQVEDSLSFYAQKIMTASTEEEKWNANHVFTNLLITTLKSAGSFDYNFTKLPTIAILSPEDKSFRLFNWHLMKDNGTFVYFGVFQSYNKSTKQYVTCVLEDKSNDIQIPQIEKLGCEHWYGAHYYKIISTKDDGKKYYTLLGWKGNNALTTKKVIDVVVINKTGRPTFGQSIFKAGKKAATRIVFEYSAEVSMSLRYDEKSGLIIYDHLSPKDLKLQGQFQYYGPDFSYDALEFRNGKWHKIENYDARNERFTYSKKEEKLELEKIHSRYKDGEIAKDEYFKELERVKKKKELRKKMNIKPQESKVKNK